MKATSAPWALVLALGACAPATSAVTTAHPAVVADGPVLRADGTRTSFEAMLDELATARVVCVGERHDATEDHALERAIVRGLVAREGDTVVGLEMIERDRQPILDRYAVGELTLDALPAALDWEARWGGPFADYVGLFEERPSRVVALNARREVVSLVAREGEDAARARFGDEVPPLPISPEYEAFVGAALAGHAGLDDASLGRFVRAQRTWDETMASRAAESLPARGRVVVVAGAMHCAYGLGIPSALRARGVEPVVVVLPVAADVPALDGRPRAEYLVDFAPAP